MTEEAIKDGQGSLSSKKKTNYIVIGLFAILGAVVFGSLLGANKQSNQMQETSVSGILQYSGLKPTKESGKITNIVLMQKEVGTVEFIATDSDVNAQDNANWIWTEAISGKSYDIRADLMLDGEFVKSSNTIRTTAPASSQVLDMHVKLSDIPDYIIEESEVTISGITDINGYMPSGSTISVWQKLEGTTEFALIVEGLPASANTPWSWDNANIGKEYAVKSILTSQGQNIGTSAVVTVAAPSDNVVLKIASTASAPVKKATVAGIVKLNGPIENGSTILMLQKIPGAENYTEFQRIKAIDGANFKWTEAASGQNYEITAALQVNEQNISSGNVISVVAPASNEVITINTGLSLTPPNNKPKVDCGEKDATDHWNASVTFTKVENAEKYYLQIGSEPGMNDVESAVVNAGNSEPKANFSAQNGKQYYSRYAYTYCLDCSDDLQNWSGYSPTLSFVCQ